MKVKQLAKLLKELDQDAVIDLSSDEEGNSYGDIGEGFAEGILEETGEKVYTIYPEGMEDPISRYKEE